MKIGNQMELARNVLHLIGERKKSSVLGTNGLESCPLVELKNCDQVQ